MRSVIKKCEDMLAAMHRRKHCILTGRGATSLWMIYKLLPVGRSGIILPATLCLSPWCVAKMAGCKVYFADVRRLDGTIDPVSVKAILQKHSDVGLILAANIYGNPVQIDELMNLCREYNVQLVEDAAQALGGQYADGRMFGECGDLAVLSFGYTKILEAGGGGAILTNDNSIADNLRSMVKDLPSSLSRNALALSKEYSGLYYSIWRCSHVEPEAIKLFSHFPDVFRDTYLLSATADIAGKILAVLPRLPVEMKRRREIAAEYGNVLSSFGSVEILTQRLGVPWRFTFMVQDDIREPMLSSVRSQGFDVSSWYAPVATWCGSDVGEDVQIPVAEMLSRRVVNLWVNEDYQTRWHDVLSCVERFLSAS